MKVCNVDPAINVSIPWKFHAVSHGVDSVQWQPPACPASQWEAREVTGHSLTSQTSEPALPVIHRATSYVAAADLADQGPWWNNPPGSSSERPVVLWKTLPAATFVSPLGLAGQTSKPPVLDCRPAAGNPDLSCATRAPIRAQPHSFDRLGAGRTDSEEDGQHGRLLHTNSQHSRRMDGPCGHCE